MTISLKPLERPTLLHHSVQDVIKNYILDNHLHVGDALPSEMELSQTLNVSRNSVREAVKVLESQDVVEIRRGSGLFVGQLSFETILDGLHFKLLFDLKELVHLTQMRHVLERGLIDIAIDKMTNTQIEKLKTVLKKIKLKTEKNESYLEEDRAFHQLISEPLNNPMLLKVVEMFWLAYTKATEKYGDLNHPELKKIYQNHVDIVESLEARDKSKAIQAIDKHYQVAEAYMNQVHTKLESSA